MVVRVDCNRLAARASTATRLTYRDDSAETPLFTRRDFGNIATFLVFRKEILTYQAARVKLLSRLDNSDFRDDGQQWSAS